MNKVLAILLLSGVGLYAQSGPSYDNAPPMSALISATGSGPFGPMETTGTSGTAYDYAPPMLLLGYNSTTHKYYVCGAANPCTSAGGGTVPSTSNILTGNGSGGVSDAGFAANDVMRLSTTQTVTGAKTFTGAVTANVFPATKFVGRTQTGALNQTLLSSAVGAMYRISIASNCDIAVASAAYNLQLSYADPSGTTHNISSSNIDCTTLGDSSAFNVVNVANLKSGSAVVLTSSTTGAVSYDVAVTVEQITSN